MPMVVKTETSAARNSTSSIRRSRITRARRRARRSPRIASLISVVWPGTADMKKASRILYKQKPAGDRISAAGGQERLLELGFALQQFVDRHADLGHPAEHGALLAVLQVVERDLVGRLGQRHVLHFLRQLAAVFHVVLDELLDLGLAERL